jgi:phenylacetate-coenzyme A ligase PaaK-like adenylate-forming protein
MPTAIELHREGRDEELWQMCCGFLSLSISDFMDIQKRLLLEQLELLNNCKLGEKIMRGARPKTVEEFRQTVPLTTYKDYCPELLEKREDILPGKPELWAHTSGRSGEYPCKWVPISHDYALELSKILYGIGMISCARGWGDTSRIPDKIRLLYSVAPRPYISGLFADVLRMQTPLEYLPPLDEAENLTFEERIRLGFQQAMSQGLDYFFGLSLVLVAVGDKFRQQSQGFNLRPYVAHPSALWRLGKGLMKSRLAGRQLLPKDIWSLKGIIGSGVDSLVYKDKIREYWGRNPLDLYSCTEGSVIATQTWDYDSMTFIPNLNFLEFIPEDEQLKLQMDRSYRPRTLLLNEVKAGENYEIIITNFYGGAMIRYRIGDMVRIQSLSNEKLGIALPQMVFERRIDDIIDFVFVRFTEKAIWQAIENSGIPYTDWVAYKKEGESVLQVCLETADGCRASATEVAEAIYKQITKLDDNDDNSLMIRHDFADFIEFKIDVTLLPKGTFSNYTTRRQAEGADIAHLKPPHVNPSPKTLSYLLAETEEIIEVTKRKAITEAGILDKEKSDKIAAEH